MTDTDKNELQHILSTHCAAQRKEIAVKAFTEFLNRCLHRCKDLTGIFTAVMSLLLGWRGGVGGI